MIVIVSDNYSDGDDVDDHGVGITGCQMSPLLQTAVPQGQTSLQSTPQKK